MSPLRRWAQRSARIGLWILGLWMLVAGCTSAQDAGQPDDRAVATTSLPPTSTTQPTVAPDPSSDEPTTTSEAPVSTTPLSGSYVPQVVDSFPHDPTSYTQGLELLDGELLESAGRFGESDRRLVTIETGTPRLSEPIDPDFFGEGLTVVDGRIWHLTWLSGVAMAADSATLAETARTNYQGEGWGICYDGTDLVMSNGSDTLMFRDPTSFEARGTVEVRRADGSPVELLNELECVNGQVLANVYTTDEIVVINPTSGVVEATIDGSSLRPAGAPANDADFAFNGIAHDSTTGHYYLTGKWWPILYEVVLVPA